ARDPAWLSFQQAGRLTKAAPSGHHCPGEIIRKSGMDPIEISKQAEKRWPLSLEGLRLRFRDPALESAYRDDRFRHNVVNIRFAFLAGIALWLAWGLLLRPHILALSDRRLDAIMRLGVFIPML